MLQMVYKTSAFFVLARIAQENVRSDVLASTQPLRPGELACFRGVAFPETFVPDPSNMGPPPDGRRAPSGRYNHEGQRVLYLSGSLNVLAREVKPGSNTVWAQQYTLSCNRLRIADFRPPVEPLTNHVFWWTETASEDRGTRFLFSQFVADRVAQFFDGMIVAGVRGDGSFRYFNVIVVLPEGALATLAGGGIQAEAIVTSGCPTREWRPTRR